MTAFFLFVLACLVSVATTAALLSSRLKRHLMDHPNERSLHDSPTPRVGGIGICTGMFVAFLGLIVLGTEMPPAFLYVMAGALIVMVVSFVDDLARLSPGFRILFHFAAAAVLVAGGLAVGSISVGGSSLDLPAMAATAFALLYVVWLTNLYNFMDGMDGFAGGMTTVGFGVLALLAVVSGAPALAAVAACIAGASTGFLGFNFPPARVFMGDVGASTLGFLAAALSLWADRQQVVPLWISVLIFSPFIVDATVTLARRGLRLERVWQAHKTHYYQKLVQLGWGHRKTVLAEYGLMLACGGSAFLAHGSGRVGQWTVIAFWAIVYALLIVLVHRMETRQA